MVLLFNSNKVVNELFTMKKEMNYTNINLLLKAKVGKRKFLLVSVVLYGV